MEIHADTQVRISVAEIAGVAFEGSPAEVRFTDLATGTTVKREALTSLGAPRLVAAEWDAAGATVRAELDIVARRYCSVADVKGYRQDQYAINTRCTDADVEQAIARAEEVIEAECGRYLQPVMRIGWVDRGSCPDRRYRNMISGSGGYQVDIISIVRATSDGEDVDIRPVHPGSNWVDVTALPVGGSATVAFTCGIPTPAEMAPAVIALAALYLAPSTGPDNAISASTELGVLRYVIGGVNGAATSIPEVNALIQRHGLAKCGVA
ncbi:hypothetical protein K6V98_00180 [Collinsella sp. AGMB00827]|uniref:Uncharacterized protein n=1 Tax=Collinsella ureilytica TaxID=2869515 RepID=A0ABS7MHM3_9ACTN|nr:hypothetical protein [Collinsella urealyticum]MBY4796787.1 hypothetical protein [Collinsella urealyticum]